MTIQRLENVGIVVDDLAVATAFFVELGLKVLGEGPGGSAQLVEGAWVDRVVGLEANFSGVSSLQNDGDLGAAPIGAKVFKRPGNAVLL